MRCLRQWRGVAALVVLVGLVSGPLGWSAGSGGNLLAQKTKSAAANPAAVVGVTRRVFHPEAARNWRGGRHELRVTLWYPAAPASKETAQVIGPPDAPLFTAGMAAPDAALVPGGRLLPLILLSHGTGGSAAQMAWLGTALARAGFVAAAVDHPGNNSAEPYTAEGFTLWWERATDLSQVLDALEKDEAFGPRLDRERVGAAGFSLGGYTVMELAGAQTDMSVVYDRCRKEPDAPVCTVPEMKASQPPVKSAEDMLGRVRKTSGESLARSGDSFRDDRVRAVFAIAPALGQTMTHESLRAIRVPVALVVGDADPIAAAPENADLIREQVRGAREDVLEGGIAHYTFLDTCTAAGKAQLGDYCADKPGADREAVHAQVAAMAVEFFRRALRVK